MSALIDTIEELLGFMRTRGIVPPVTQVLIAELSVGEPRDELGRLHFRRDRLQTPIQYQERFEALLDAGYAWINVSCYGVHDGSIVVAIEIPSGLATPGCRTSVNYSGPASLVQSNGWDVTCIMVID